MPRQNSVSSAHSCPHFDSTNRDIIAKYIENLTQIRLQRTLSQFPPASRSTLTSLISFKEQDDLKCFKCKKNENEAPKPLYVCTSCFVAGCWSTEFHLKAHFNETHPLAIEISSGTIYCGLCELFIWNSTLEAISKNPSSLDRLLTTQSIQSKSASPTKKKKGTDSGAVETGSDNVSKHCYALRGMTNLGSTCFMASVLQVLLHCKPLMDYFLSCQHSPKQCPKRNQKSSVCMACELDTLFNRNFNGEIGPLAPFEFLHGMWRSSKHLSGYEQQDAHEFLISLLNQLHGDLGGSHFACKCPVHTHFTGVLQSDVTCLSCGTVNASFDPFIDVSLDILTSANDSNFVFDPTNSSLTLNECFQLFTHAEKLSSNTYMCANCNHTYQEATKQLSIRKAPEILTIHLKRFEHSFNTVKIDTFLQFPSEFSIFDYTTEGVHLGNEVERISSNGTGLNALNQPALSPSVIDPAYNLKKYSNDMLYRLVATVNHSGVVDSGHYVSYARNGDDSWFKFDDAMVSKVPITAVLNSNPYMLFYERVGSPQNSNNTEAIAID